MQGDRCSNGVCWRVGGRRAESGCGAAGRCAPRQFRDHRRAARCPETCSSVAKWSSVVLFTILSQWPYSRTMVVLEGGGALLEPALALDGATAACLERAYAQADVSLKLLPKRYINLHQWLSPVTTSVTAAAAAGKDLKLQIVRAFLLKPTFGWMSLCNLRKKILVITPIFWWMNLNTV